MSYMRKPVRGRGRHKLPHSRIFAKRTITKEYEVYTFDELSDKAKENVRQWYLDDETRTWDFTDMVNEDLNEKFPNSELKVEYSLGYSQGDGLNIYGSLDGEDALNYVKSELSPQEISDINLIISDITLKLKSNNRYQYCIVDRQDFVGQIFEVAADEAWYHYEQTHDNANGDLDWENYSEASALREAYSPTFEESIDVFCGTLEKKLMKFCKVWEEEGYSWFYEIDDNELSEMCEVNNWEFDEDGKIMY